jgi:predicted acyltransferase
MSSNQNSRARFRSLDAFRGATVAFMILVNNPGTWSALYEPLKHASWHGCTPTDLIFPFFLFAVGNALALVMKPGDGDRTSWTRILRRTAAIFAIGLFLNACPFVEWNQQGELVLKSFSDLRYLGVLQRIGLSFGAAAVMIKCLAGDGSIRRVIILSSGILAAYWAICWFGGEPKDPYSLEGYLGTKIDRAVLGESHLYHGEGAAFDPEGLLSTLPSIAQVLLGWCAGRIATNPPLSFETLGKLALFGVYCLAIAWVWQLLFPLNKKIWTSSFVLYTTGLATLGLSLAIHIVELSGYGTQKPSDRASLWAQIIGAIVRFFEWFGKNPLFLFVLSSLLPRVLPLIRWDAGTNAQGEPVFTSLLPWLHKTLFAPISSDPRLGSFLYSVALLMFFAIIAWVLDRKKIYIRV